VKGRPASRALSPRVRPEPCEVGPFASDNLALDRPTTASAEESDEYDAAKVVDGSVATWWSAAEGAPQRVEIDRGKDMTVSRVEILVGFVSPSGPQTHQVRVGSFAEGAATTEVAEWPSRGPRIKWTKPNGSPDALSVR